MSLKKGLLWSFPAICVASWLAVRSPAASEPPSTLDGLSDPPVPLTTARSAREVRDPALGRLVARYAAVARFAPR